MRNLTAIPGFQKPARIAEHLKLESDHVMRVIEFLLHTGLCMDDGRGLSPGPLMTHLGNDSPLVARHHANWRVRALDRHPVLDAKRELAYTAPMTLSEADAPRVRTLLAELVQKTDEIVGPSPSEKLYCLNLDWFEVR